MSGFGDMSGSTAPCAKCRKVDVELSELALSLMESWNRTHPDEPLRRDHIALCPTCHELWLVNRRMTQARYTERSLAAWRKYKDDVRSLSQSMPPREAIDRITRNLGRWRHDASFLELKARWDAWFGGEGQQVATRRRKDI